MVAPDSLPLPMYTVYERPEDFPEEYVIREHLIYPGRSQAGRLVARGPTLEAVREQLLAINPNLVPLDRDPNDNPSVVETWL